MNPSTQDRLLGLLIITGFMLLITALPLGAVLCLHDHYKFQSDWHWAITLGVGMTIATAVVGGIFLGTGEFIVKRRRKRQERMTQNDAA
jgi:hypothetical protein